MRSARRAALALAALFATSTLLAPAAAVGPAPAPITLPEPLPAAGLDERLAELRAPAAVAPPDLPAVAAATPEPVVVLLDGPQGPAPDLGRPGTDAVALPPALAGPVAVLKDLTYLPCGQVPGKPVVCLPAPVPLGAPAAIDVDRDPLTGPGGLDVVVRLDPNVVPLPELPGALAGTAGEPSADAVGPVPGVLGGLVPDALAVDLEVQVLPRAQDLAASPLAPTRALPAKVWATYALATPDGVVRKFLSAGFDGTWAPAGGAPTLAGLSSARLTLEDWPALLQGRALARLDASFTKPGPAVAVFGSFADADAAGNPRDPTTAAFRTAPASAFTARVDARTDGSRIEGTLVTPGSPVGTFTYDARRGASTTRAEATLTTLPGEASVVYEKTAAGVRLTYDASAPVGRVDASYRSERSGETLDGALVVRGLPDHVVLDLAPGRDGGRVTVDGSAAVAALDGTLAATRGGDTTVATAALRNLPRAVTASWDSSAGPQRFGYAASAPWGPATFGYQSGAGKPAFEATLEAPIPDRAEVRWDPAGHSLAWDASAPVGRVAATATLPRDGRVWNAAMTLVGVPAQWSASFAPDHPVFRGGSAPLAGLAFRVTNHGAVTTYAGNHLSMVLAPNGDMDASLAMSSIELAEFERTAQGFRADLRMGGGQPFTLHADVTAQGAKARADLAVSPLPRSLQVSQAGDLITYAADTNFDLTGYTEVGRAAGLPGAPAPPAVRGLSARDGYGCDATGCGRGIKARVWLEGFPTGFTADARSRTFTVTNFRPPADACAPTCVQRDFLTLDADLGAPAGPGQPAQRVRVLATQRDIPSPVSFTFGPVTVREQTTVCAFPRCVPVVTGKETTAQFTSTGPLGALTADVIVGDVAGRLEVSNVPSSIAVTIVQGRQASSATVAMSQGIARIFAGAWGTVNDVGFAGGLELLQVPATVSLAWGRGSATSGSDSYTAPTFRYEGSAAGLDVNAWVDARLFGGDVQAAARLGVADLERSVSLTLDGNTLSLSSRPCSEPLLTCLRAAPTRSFEIHAWGRITARDSDSGCKNVNGNPNCSATYLKWSYDLSVHPLTIDDFAVRVTNVGSLTLKLGVVTSVQGSFDSFHLGWQSIRGDIDFAGSLAAKQESCTWLGCFTTTLGTASIDAHLVDQPIHLALYTFGEHETQAQCWAHVLEVHIRPHRHGAYNVNRVDFPRPTSAEGGAWFFMPVPASVATDPDWKTLAELVAGRSSPLGGGIKGVLATC